VNLHKSIREAFTVEYLMTPRERLETASECPTPRGNPRYDVIPRTAGERIVGLWVLREGKYVSEPLTEEWLLAHSTPIREVIRLFSTTDAKPAYLVVNGARVDGIVSPADLNKVACRTYLFTLIGELEYWLGKLIRRRFSKEKEGKEESKEKEEEKAAIALLSPARKAALDDERQRMQGKDMDIGYIDILSLADIVNIVAKDETLREQLGYQSRKQVEKDLNGLVHLRNDVAHLVRKMSFLSCTDDILQKLERIETLLERITESLKESRSARASSDDARTPA
jgi:hypothetical protein